MTTRPAQETPANNTVVFQKNEFRREALPDPAKLERLKSGAPEVYAAFVKQFEADAEHNREMQRRAMAIDEKVVPMLPWNDRLGIIASGGVAILCLVLAFITVREGLPYGWAIGILGALPPVIAAIRWKGGGQE